MAQSTENNDLEDLLSASKDQLEKTRQTWEKLELLFAKIQKEAGPNKLSLLRNLQAEFAIAESVLKAQRESPKQPTATESI